MITTKDTKEKQMPVYTPIHTKKILNCRLEIWIYLLLTCCIMAVYWQVRTFSYINYDSPEYVFANNHVQSGLTLENIRWALTTTYFSNWHPLTWISHMLDFQVYGLNAGQHKLTNVLFHIVNTLLLFLILKRMTGDIVPSALVAGLFALHPLHIQSVAWIAERKDVLSAFFFFLSILLYLRYLELKSISRYCLILLTYILGLMAKPMIVTFPLIVILLDFWPLGRFSFGMNPSKKIPSISLSKGESLKALLMEKIPFFILTIISSIITIHAQEAGGSVASLVQLPVLERISNAAISYLLYLYKTVWPVDLSIIYPYPDSQPLWLIIIACLGLFGLSYLFLYHFRRYHFLAFGWLFFLIMLVPVIGIIQVGVQALADRYMYLPIIGLFIIFSWGLMHLLQKYSLSPLVLFSLTGAFLVTILAFVSWQQLQYWKNGITLFTRAISITEKNYIAHLNLGYELVQKLQFGQAEKHFEQALQINPINEIAHLNLGRMLIEDKKYEEGIEHYRMALKIKPDYADAHNNLGNTLLHLGETREAAYHYLQALRLKTVSVQTYNNLGAILVKDQKYEEAITMFKKALELNPSFLKAKENIARTLSIIRDQNQKEDKN
jgi:protein O-mannosyl-transferase